MARLATRRLAESPISFAQETTTREFSEVAEIEMSHGRTIVREFVAEPTTKPTSAHWQEEGSGPVK